MWAAADFWAMNVEYEVKGNTVAKRQADLHAKITVRKNISMNYLDTDAV